MCHHDKPEMPELMGMSDRIMVMRGPQVRELSGDDISDEKIMLLASTYML